MTLPEYLSGGRIQGKTTDTSGDVTTGWAIQGSRFTPNGTTGVFDFGDENNTEHTAAYDLGSTQGNTWALRCKVYITGDESSDGNLLIGLSDDSTSGGNTVQDWIGARIHTPANNLFRPHHTMGSGDVTPRAGSDANVSTTISVNTNYYLEIKRVSDTSYSYRWTTNSDFSGGSSASYSISAGTVTGLRYIKIMNPENCSNCGAGGFAGYIDDLQYWADGDTTGIATHTFDFELTDESKAAITDVPVGTRYEETDTRKIFRRSTVPEVVTSNTYQQSNTGDTGGGFNPSYTSSSSIPNRTGLAITGAGHTLVNKKIKTVRFWIKTSGSAGNLIMKCYGSDDNVKETGSTVALSAIGSSYAYHTFNFTGGSYPTIENGDVLSIEGQASSNPSDTDISFEFSTSSDGNCDHAVWYDSAWNHQTNRETKIEVDTIVEAYDTWKEKGTA